MNEIFDIPVVYLMIMDTCEIKFRFANDMKGFLATSIMIVYLSYVLRIDSGE